MSNRTGAKRSGLTPFDLLMLGFGSIIGAGLFVASGMAVRQAGPAVLITFVVGAVALLGVLTGLAEMAAANPDPGGLRTYARDALGPWMGFTVGWMYWTSGTFTMSSELTAAALLASLWFPHMPLWSLALIFALGVTALNFLSPSAFGKVEDGLAAVKVFALIAFIGIGAWALFRGQGTGLHELQAHGFRVREFFPSGARGLIASLLMVMVTYAGVQVVAMAAPETNDPSRTMPRGIRNLTVSVVALYLAAFTVLVLILPWHRILPGESPFVQALGSIGLTGLDHILNFVILTAALSALNSTLFGISRMLRALATDGEAPRIFLRSNARGIPAWALGGTSLMLSIAVVVSYLVPSHAYQLVTSASASIAMFSWTMIGVCHLRLRPRFEREGRLVYRAGGFPYVTMATIAICAFTFLTVPLAHGQAAGQVVGVAQFTLVSLVYYLFIRPRRRRGEPGGGRPVGIEAAGGRLSAAEPAGEETPGPVGVH